VTRKKRGDTPFAPARTRGGRGGERRKGRLHQLVTPLAEKKKEKRKREVDHYHRSPEKRRRKKRKKKNAHFLRVLMITVCPAQEEGEGSRAYPPRVEKGGREKGKAASSAISASLHEGQNRQEKREEKGVFQKLELKGGKGKRGGGVEHVSAFIFSAHRKGKGRRSPPPSPQEGKKKRKCLFLIACSEKERGHLREGNDRKKERERRPKKSHFSLPRKKERKRFPPPNHEEGGGGEKRRRKTSLSYSQGKKEGKKKSNFSL